MELPGGRDSRFNLGYSMNLLSGETPPEIYGSPNLGRPSTSLQQLSPRHTMVSSACGGRGHNKSDVCYDERGMSSQGMTLDNCGVSDMSEDPYNSMQSKKSPPSNGKKTKGRVKIKMEYIENKLRRYTTFSKRKTGIMKKAYELSTLTGTQVMLLVASETGHVYTFATRKLQPMITSEAGKALIQTCLNSPDPPVGSAGGDQRMSATGFEETELTYNISDEDSKEVASGSASSSDEDEFEIPAEDNQEHVEQILVSPDPLPYTPKLSSGPSIASTPNSILSSQTTSLNDKTDKIFLVKTENSTSTSVSKSQPIVTTAPSLTVKCEKNESILPGNQTTISQPLDVLSTPSSQIESNLKDKTLTVNSIATSDIQYLQTQIKALPLLVQTGSGLGYATLPDGNILGMLQGIPNPGQPQLIAIPLSSLLSSSISTIPSNSGISKGSSSNSNDKGSK